MKAAPAFLAALAAFALPASAQKMQTPAGEAPGPWILGTIGIGKQPDGTMKTTALKGLAIKVCEHGEAAVAYDLDLCRMAGAWTGKFTTPMNLMSRGEYPTAMGEVAFTTGDVAGFITESKEPWKDPRAEPFGPLTTGQARFRGFYVNGDKTILKWDIGEVEVLESPSYETGQDAKVVIRSFQFSPSKRAVLLPICPPQPGIMCGLVERDSAFDDFEWREEAGIYRLWVPPLAKTTAFRIYIAQYAEGSGASKKTRWYSSGKTTDFAIFTKGGPARWPEPVVTAGELSKDTESAYVVDTIKLPDPNPWGAPIFVGGFDFFPDGRAAICTFHGDVFIVDGLDEKLEKVTWRRFASGLYHALGLKIVKGEIYVTCRDGIWRLKDLNGDGEADFYEAFNFDVKVTKSFHEFVFDLQTDPAGNFYFAKAGPVKNGGRGFDQIMAHHGSLFRVSPDGAKFEVIATGFRAPNGIGVGPHGELTSGDNEGTWTPACKINWIKPGGFYGVVPLSHRDPLPTSYDPPLCWLPKRVDNSGGSQVWAPEGDRWGPWGGKMLHLSYGKAALYGVLMEERGTRSAERGTSNAASSALSEFHVPPSALVQGGVTKFPLQFQSGIMRARFNPKDGQLYVSGLRGWQTSGLKNGCLQRVRYTGAETRMPIELHVKQDGIELRFTTSLDTQSASDVENWHLEQWRYLWSAAYGSPELSTETDPDAPGEAGQDGAAQFTKAQMSVAKHDSVSVKSVTIGTDDRTIFLEIPGLKPVMQMSIKYDFKTADGNDLRGEVVNTIHEVGK